MGLSNTPSSERTHIGIFGCTNAGKSSLINAITSQDLAIVSQIKGTTTDPVSKAMELLPLGPVMIIDTPGLDDESELGLKRIEKTYQVLRKTDVAILVVDGITGYSEYDFSIIKKIEDMKIPLIVAINKSEDERISLPQKHPNEILVSAKSGKNIEKLKSLIAIKAKSDVHKIPIIGDLINEGDSVVLVTPIDSAAPKGRLILPQQQTIRDILDNGGICLVCKEDSVRATLENMKKKPKLVVTDSQVFGKAAKDTPDDIMLTSFSILFARHKGNLELAVNGCAAIDKLCDGDKILISEGCTHHRQCDDIGTVKIPSWLKEYTKKQLVLEFSTGTEFYDDLSKYALVIHCGGCMLNDKEMAYRYRSCEFQGVPITNYGLAIAHMKGILKRSLEIFPNIAQTLC